VIAPELKRPHRPRALEVVFQPKLVSETIEEGGRRMLSCRQHHENGALVAGVIRAPTSTENAFAVVPQNVEAVISFSAGARS